MTFSIEKFKSKGLIYGGARPSLFRVFIPPFDGVEFGSVNTHNLSEEISFLAKAASIPASMIDYIDVPYFSRKVRVNGDRTFADWSITCMNDEDFTIRAAFEQWHEFINSREPNRQFGDGFALVSAYKRDLIVYQYGKTGNGAGDGSFNAGGTLVDDATPIAKYVMHGAFPTSISPIGLDWDYVNQIEQFDVTFAYDYWEPYENTGSLTNAIPLPNG